MLLDSAQLDRAIGCVVASACGDALGSQYEFGGPLAPDQPVEFGPGYFGHGVGEWTDDTAMASPVLLALSEGRSFDEPDTFAFVLEHWLSWSEDAFDVGAQTAAVLGALRADNRGEAGTGSAGRTGSTAGTGAATAPAGADATSALKFERDRAEPPITVPAASALDAAFRPLLARTPLSVSEDAARAAARNYHERRGRSAGNGSLMRTGPLTLGFLAPGREDALAAAATRLAELTHWESDNAAACALWCLAIRHAILTGAVDVESQLSFIPTASRDRWSQLIDEALAPDATPTAFANHNGWVVAAFQQSLAAINTTNSLVAALEAAIRPGGDTDTVAAITGALAGARYGASALPSPWLEKVHGWPDNTSVHTLTALAHSVANPNLYRH